MGMSDAKVKDPLPEEFETIEAAAEFWDTHSLAEYWEETESVEFEVDLTRRVYWVALEHELAEKVAERANAEGVSSETLVNVWVAERLLVPNR